jgi:GT2 family glycosyltransferase
VTDPAAGPPASCTKAPGVPRVSVVVPVRDRRALLRQTLDALARQTLADHEVVVVDDGSSDGSGEEAAADAASGRPVRVVRTVGCGAVVARGLGAAAARAPYLAFTDSDCVPDPGWLAAGVAALDEGFDLVQGPTYPMRRPRLLEHAVSVGREDGLYATCNVFYRRAAFEAAGGFDSRAGERLGFRPGRRLRGLGFGEDTLLAWRVRRSGRAAFATGAVVRHQVVPAGPSELARRAWSAGAFPALVREVPELRSTLLVGGIALGSLERLPLYGAAVLAGLRRPRGTLGLLACWALLRSAPVLAEHGPVPRRLAKVPLALGVGLLEAAALATGSLRARTPVV